MSEADTPAHGPGTQRVVLEITSVTNPAGWNWSAICADAGMGNEIAQSVRVVSDEEREAELASLRDANDKLWRDKCSLIEKLRPLNEAIPPMFDSNGDRLPSLGALHQLIAEREAAVVRVAKLEEQAERVDAAVGATAEKFVNGHNALKARVEKLEKQHVDAEMLRHALAKSEIERLKAIRARDEAAEFWKGELRSRTAERDAAIRERESWKLLADRTNERLSAAEARVAELEAASGGREGAPDAWGVVRDGNVQSVMHRLFCNKAGDIAEKTGGTVVPLYRAPARNEAVRAAEDGRTGTLPTPGECIVAPFAEAAERSSTASKTGEGQSGLRTERVTLEVTHDLDAPLGDWIVAVIDESLGFGESVRVVEESAG